MSQAQVPDVQSVVRPTAGALLIGVLFSVCLFGANTLQTWYYYQHYPKDGTLLQILVAGVWIFENFNNIPGLNITPWSASMTLAITAILILIIHLFFAWRVYVLSGRQKFVPVIITGFALAHSGMTWVVVGQSFAAGRYSKFPKSIKYTSTVALVVGVATDLLVAISLGYFLNRGRSGILKTDKIINRLIFWSVNIGILTSLTDFVVVMTSELEDDLVFLAIYQIISNLYAASMLATLNLRPFTRNHVLDEHGTTLEIDSFRVAPISTTNENGTFFAERSITTINDSNKDGKVIASFP